MWILRIHLYVQLKVSSVHVFLLVWFGFTRSLLLQVPVIYSRRYTDNVSQSLCPSELGIDNRWNSGRFLSVQSTHNVYASFVQCVVFAHNYVRLLTALQRSNPNPILASYSEIKGSQPTPSGREQKETLGILIAFRVFTGLK